MRDTTMKNCWTCKHTKVRTDRSTPCNLWNQVLDREKDYMEYMRKQELRMWLQAYVTYRTNGGMPLRCLHTSDCPEWEVKSDA